MSKNILDTPNSVDLEEEIIELYHRLESRFTDSSCPIIQFVSAHADEGVTTICYELARVAVKHFGKSVLVLNTSPNGHNQGSDTSQQKSATSPDKEIGTSDDSAFTTRNDFSDYHEIVREPQGYDVGLFLAPDTSLAKIFSGQHYQKYTELVRAAFDLIIIDSPPISESSAILAASSKVDGIILVMAAETTRWPVTARLKERIEKSGGHILGIVLNKQRHYIPDFIYRHLL